MANYRCKVVYAHNGIYLSAMRNDGNLSLHPTWMKPESIMLSKLSQKKINKAQMISPSVDVKKQSMGIDIPDENTSQGSISQQN